MDMRPTWAASAVCSSMKVQTPCVDHSYHAQPTTNPTSATHSRIRVLPCTDSSGWDGATLQCTYNPPCLGQCPVRGSPNTGQWPGVSSAEPALDKSTGALDPGGGWLPLPESPRATHQAYHHGLPESLGLQGAPPTTQQPHALPPPDPRPASPQSCMAGDPT
jgi:hypothetical protein